MRDLLKGIFGGSAPLPDGVTREWVGELEKMLAEAHVIEGSGLTGHHLDAAVEFVLRGQDGAWTHPVQPSKPGGYVSYRHKDRPEQPQFYSALDRIPADVLLRWAQVLEAMTPHNRYSRFHIQFPGNVHWPELVLLYGSGGSINSWPVPTAQRIPYATIERALVAAGMEPHALLVGAFATPVDAGYMAGNVLALVSHCPDFQDALDRHLEAIRPLVLAGRVPQRVHVLGMLDRASPATRDRLVPELAELAASSSKQVRMAADGFVQSAGDVVVPELRRFALEGKPEQRLLALRHLHARGKRSNDAGLAEFARSTAAADKAASVQALLEEWQAAAEADAAPESNYEVELPSVDWSVAPRPETLARLERLWADMNALIRADNQRAREHYEKHTQKHGKPSWPLRQANEIPASWLKSLKALLASGGPPGAAGQTEGRGHWVALPAVRALAGEALLSPTELFKLLHHLAQLHGRDGQLSGLATDCFNRLYAGTGKPSLAELATMMVDAGGDAAPLFGNLCAPHYAAIGANWRDKDVWPYVARFVPLIERHLQGLEPIDFHFSRSRLYAAIGTLPTIPPRIANALYAVALGEGRSERQAAQQSLARLPGKEARIISALSDGKSTIRMVAAQWLGQLRFAEAIPALEKAVATEKQDNAKGALLDALEALGQPVEKYLRRDVLLPEAKKSLAKGLPKDLAWLSWGSLPDVHWADSGERVPPEVLQWMVSQACRANSPEPNAVLRKYCAMFEPRGRERFGQWVLDQWLAEDVSPIPAEEAHRRARSSAQALVNSMRNHPQYYQGNPQLGKSEEELFAFYLPGQLRQPKGSAVASKGILAVAAACAAGNAAAPVARYIKEWYGTRAAQGKALIAMLAWIDHPSATQVMLAIGNRFRTKSIQEEATKQAQALAERRGWTLAELADRTIPTGGFDEQAELELSYGQRSFLARLLPDFKIELFNPEGKKIASLPDPRQDDDEELAKQSKKSLAASKKELKSIVELQTDRLYEALCTGRDWPFTDWNDYLNGHPVVRHLVQRLVWLHSTPSGGYVAFRPMADGSLTNDEDEAVQPPPDARVRLAHDSLLDTDAVKRWQQHLVDYEIKPLFQQLGKGTYELPLAQANAREILDFKGHLVETFALRGRANKLGYQRGAAEDGGWFHVYEKRFPTLGTTAVVEFTGNGLPEENRTAALLGLWFTAAGAQGGGSHTAIPLGRIPKVLLSECYNDMRLMAAEGKGFDPEWEKKSEY